MFHFIFRHPVNMNRNAIVHGKATARVHSVHLMNACQRRAAADLLVLPTWLQPQIRLQAAIVSNTVTIYCHSARQLILSLPAHGEQNY